MNIPALGSPQFIGVLIILILVLQVIITIIFSTIAVSLSDIVGLLEQIVVDFRLWRAEE